MAARHIPAHCRMQAHPARMVYQTHTYVIYHTLQTAPLTYSAELSAFGPVTPVIMHVADAFCGSFFSAAGMFRAQRTKVC